MSSSEILREDLEFMLVDLVGNRRAFVPTGKALSSPVSLERKLNQRDFFHFRFFHQKKYVL